jgi:hypothetical protein
MFITFLQDFIEKTVLGEDDQPVTKYRNTTHRDHSVDWRIGATLDVSDASGRKFLALNQAREATEEEVAAFFADREAQRAAAAAKAAAEKA